jgi:hypothetical protein
MTMNILEPKIYGNFVVQVATEAHHEYADQICAEMESSAKARGTGIAKRNPQYIKLKMAEGKAVICLTTSGEWVGFCYIETWDHGKFVANSGLIVAPDYRKSGMATYIKAMAFKLSRTKYPEAKIIGLTTSLAVMKINSELGYHPVPFSELPKDEDFWKGCSSCVNFDILNRTNRAHCLCTGMKYEPPVHKEEKKTEFWDFISQSGLYEGFMRMKQRVLLNREEKSKKKVPVPVKKKVPVEA